MSKHRKKSYYSQREKKKKKKLAPVNDIRGVLYLVDPM